MLPVGGAMSVSRIKAYRELLASTIAGYTRLVPTAGDPGRPRTLPQELFSNAASIYPEEKR